MSWLLENVFTNLSMSQAIGRLFNVGDDDHVAVCQATAVSLMHKGMVRKMAQELFNVKPNATALKHLAPSEDETVLFLKNIKSSDASGTLLESFEKMVATNYPEIAEHSTGLFLYLYFMHEKDSEGKILAKLSKGVDLRALQADLKSFFNANINSDTGSEIIQKASAVVRTIVPSASDYEEEYDLLSVSSCSSSSSDSDEEEEEIPPQEPEQPELPLPVPTIPGLPAPDIPGVDEIPIPILKATPEKRVVVEQRDCTSAYFTDDIIQEFRSVVGLEKTVDRKHVAHLLLAMYLPEKVINTTAFVSLAHKLRLRPHHVDWARTYASHHPELSSHCWQTLVGSLDVEDNSEFVRRTVRNLRLPCYATQQDQVISSLAITQFNYMSIIATRLRTTTVHQDRHFRCIRSEYMQNVPVDSLSDFFENLVLPARS